jgi:hypothetical protein
LGKPFLKSVRATIDKIHGNFIYHPKNLASCFQIQVLPRLEEGKMHGGNTRAHEESPSTVKQGPKKDAMTPDTEPSAAENFSAKSTRHIKDATSAAISSPITSAT